MADGSVTDKSSRAVRLRVPRRHCRMAAADWAENPNRLLQAAERREDKAISLRWPAPEEFACRIEVAARNRIAGSHKAAVRKAADRIAGGCIGIGWATPAAVVRSTGPTAIAAAARRRGSRRVDATARRRSQVARCRRGPTPAADNPCHRYRGHRSLRGVRVPGFLSRRRN